MVSIATNPFLSQPKDADGALRTFAMDCNVQSIPPHCTAVNSNFLSQLSVCRLLPALVALNLQHTFFFFCLHFYLSDWEVWRICQHVACLLGLVAHLQSVISLQWTSAPCLYIIHNLCDSHLCLYPVSSPRINLSTRVHLFRQLQAFYPLSHVLRVFVESIKCSHYTFFFCTDLSKMPVFC